MINIGLLEKGFMKSYVKSLGSNVKRRMSKPLHAKIMEPLMSIYLDFFISPSVIVINLKHEIGELKDFSFRREF